jgi:hypothetical protein
MRRLRFCLVLGPILAGPIHAQSAPPISAPDAADAFADPGAGLLFSRAREARQRTDSSIRSYTAVVRSRLGAAMRMPLKDRTLFRQESAARVRWSRDAESVVQLLASRTQHPGGVEVGSSDSGFGIDHLFDPSHDRLYFGLGGKDGADRDGNDGEFWIEHPLGDEAERFYRFRSGDTLTLTLQDGRVVRAVELLVIPRTDNPHTVRGALWIDAATGALVQAAFRLARKVDVLRDMSVLHEDNADCSYRIGESGERRGCDSIDKMIPGFFKPFEFDISLMTVEYSLWELEHWLPRTMRFEGMMRAGVLVFPAAFAVSYDMEDVLLDGEGTVAEEDAAAATAAAWNAGADYTRVSRKQNKRPFIVLTPRDTAGMLTSDQLPPPVWRDSPGFATEEELTGMYDRLASIAGPVMHAQRQPLRFGWGWGEPDMVRYNRVEALSIGARVTLPLPAAELSAVGRIGLGDMHPGIELRALRQSMRRTLELRAYHALATADDTRNAFGIANSTAALLLGRDEGEYYRATGASLAWAPPSFRRRSWDLTGYVERQDDVARNTHVSFTNLWNDSVFRPNITADEATQYGAALRVRPWWGTDPAGAQFGVDLLVQGEAGDFAHARGRLMLRAAAPLFAGLRLGAEAGAGTSTGDVPVQRLFFLGGASTLRGYEPATVAGTSMARARIELARSYPFANLALFSDWGWAGDRTDIVSANQRLAVGVGASLLDGLIRLDLARGLRAPRGWRLDLHMDAVL